MTREDAVERLCDVYGGSFDITRCEEAELPLAAKMDFYVHNSKYVLSKKAKLWEANSFEYVYLFTVPHLTREIYEQCERLAYEQGRARIRPHVHLYLRHLPVRLLRPGGTEGPEAVPPVRELPAVLLGMDGFSYRSGGAPGGIRGHQRQRTQCSAGAQTGPVS